MTPTGESHMIIIDLTEYHGKRPSIWPDDLPDKIRLTPGEHEFCYDVHPMCRGARWYKTLMENSKAAYPHKDNRYPVGVSDYMVKDGARIVRTK